MTARQLYVFAGPNGAGKSTFAATMIPRNTPIFDGDKKFSELKAVFYDLEESTIWTLAVARLRRVTLINRPPAASCNITLFASANEAARCRRKLVTRLKMSD